MNSLFLKRRVEARAAELAEERSRRIQAKAEEEEWRQLAWRPEEWNQMDPMECTEVSAEFGAAQR